MSDNMFAENEVELYDFIRTEFFKKKETAFGTIYLALDSGMVHFKERWKLDFHIERGASNLSYQEKVDYFYKIKAEIWTNWNSYRPLPNIPGATVDPSSQALTRLLNAHHGVVFNVAGHSEFAKKFKDLGVPIDFDVRLNRSHPHWRVNVYRPKPGDEWKEKYRDEVDLDRQTIKLNYANTEPHNVCTEAKTPVCKDDFLTPPHEFGHTLQGNDDEYVARSKFLKDTDSLLNIGREVRARHFRWILRHLNTMLPKTVFSLPPN
jgi:hypothetical protein